MRAHLFLLFAGVIACGPDAEYEQRVVPNDGRIVLDLGGATMLAGSTRTIRACAFDADELQVVQHTRIWFSASDGEYLAADDPPSAKTIPDGCAEITYVAPEKAASITVDAWSGDIDCAAILHQAAV